MVKRSRPEPDADATGIYVDRDAEVPLGVQLAWALRSRIGEGRLPAGQRLPALRELAESVGVNLNTVRAVYQRLEQEGLVQSRQGSGTFVATAPGLRTPAAEIAAGAAREALEQGVSPREVAAALYVTEPTPTTATATATDPDSDRREALRGEIRSLERVLSGLQAANPGVRVPVAAPRRRSGPMLLSAAELEDVRAQLVGKLTALQKAIDSDQRDADGTPPEAPVKAAVKKTAATAPKQGPRRRGPSSPPRPATA
ncbi:MAG TPA: winged helix-turn-helix domain-containing protein [Solirubrobacteraceae bacterium]|nr:winged helix-turn-helix domain-containing protein [Solirubrobacteraceae bacterium]